MSVFHRGSNDVDAVTKLWSIHDTAIEVCREMPSIEQSEQIQRGLDSIKGISMSLIRRIERSIQSTTTK